MILGFDGRRAVIVGGSYGIGEATAAILLREGAQVLIASRSRDNLEAARARLEVATGRAPELFVADVVKDAASAIALMDEARTRWGALDILVSAVGGSVRADFDTLSDEDWLASYEFNVLSTVRSVRAALPLLAAGDTPAVVTLGAAAAKMPYAHQIMTNVHKAGLLGLVKTLALELGEKGIRINAVGPGRTKTALWINRATKMAAERGVPVEAIYAEFAEEIPLKRFAEPAEIAVMVAWLASPLASYITGQSINVDGGIARGLV
ncbi:SDR family NAD(P)-dependent oxidoreductase [Ancylobacter rudongensis]|uniref:3-oxoacyl-[acyl-carrier protein] reductase n=1 Tax=Ancylobacter rudongensis TaxID=177413 RepID=A0A1G4TJ75_9HYPH|nr:SDR family oxidoreductase [Ancylobacter rudongensis]SCW80629.1 3-oxoacyl-[acyl-carrier protein] reductase [Ancylobacter rudongensis]